MDIVHPQTGNPQDFLKHLVIGEVLELADRRDLGSCAARREGSSPSFPTR